MAATATKTTRRICTLLLSTVALGALPSVAAAQDQPANAPTASPAISNDEIIVTARRRSETLSSVPIAITAFTGDQLAAKGAIDITDLAHPKLLATWDLSQEPGMPKSGMHDLDVNDEGTRAYTNTSWMVDGVIHQGLTILDTSEVAERRPKPVIRRISSFNWGPPENFGYTHSSQLATIKGRQYVITEDETMGAQGGPDVHGVGAPWGWARIIWSGPRRVRVH